MIKGLKHLMFERLRDWGLFRKEKRRLREDMINVYKYLNWGRQIEKTESGFFFSNGTRGTWAQIEAHQILCKNKKKLYLFIYLLFTMKVVKQWKKQPRDAMKASYLFKT